MTMKSAVLVIGLLFLLSRHAELVSASMPPERGPCL
jgi:hypothetical protein